MKDKFYRSTIAIFAYNRLNSLQSVWESLMNCDGIEGRSVVIFHDGLKNHTSEIGKAKWKDVKDWLVSLYGYPNLEVKYSNNNRGLAKSIHSGVSEILSNEESVIVLEDDLVLARSFLSYMDEALFSYKSVKNIFSISGYSHFKKTDLNGTEPDVFLFPRPNSWGWATWADCWKNFELNQVGTKDLVNYKQLKFFQKGGVDLPWMLRNQIKGKIDSWAIQWTYYQFLNDALTVYPICSKVINIGFGEDATHTSSLNGAQGEICDTHLILRPNLCIDRDLTNKYKLFFKLGILTMIKNKFWMLSLVIKFKYTD